MDDLLWIGLVLFRDRSLFDSLLNLRFLFNGTHMPSFPIVVDQAKTGTLAVAQFLLHIKARAMPKELAVASVTSRTA